MINDNWKDLGFQQKNPRTDFRGGGYLSLLCLIYFSVVYEEDFREMIKATKDHESVMWLTAVTSINVTHGLKV